MKRVDYLGRQSPPWVHNVPTLTLDRKAAIALGAFSLVVVVTFATGVVERERVNVAHFVLLAGDRRLASDERRLGHLSRDALMIHRLGTAVTYIESTRQGGARSAAQFAEIGNAVPDDVSLTSIAREGTLVSIEGVAPDYTTLAATIGCLSSIAGLTNLQLLRSDESGRRPTAVTFQIQLRALAQ